MAYDEKLAQRIRHVLKRRAGITERKMFGGLAFMVAGNMCCGLLGERLVLRLGPEGAEDALKEKHTRPMDFTGKPMKSMLYIEPPGIAAEKDLKAWLSRALKFARSLPQK